MGDHDGNLRCLGKKNVPVALNFPSRWQDSAESLWYSGQSDKCSTTVLTFVSHTDKVFPVSITLEL